MATLVDGVAAGRASTSTTAAAAGCRSPSTAAAALRGGAVAHRRVGVVAVRVRAAAGRRPVRQGRRGRAHRRRRRCRRHRTSTMTVAGAARGRRAASTSPGPGCGGSRPVRSGARDVGRRARPVERGAVPGRRGASPAARCACAAGRDATTSPATGCASCSPPMGARGRARRRALTVRRHRPVAGMDVDLHDVGELTPVLAALAALRRRPVGTCAASATCAGTRPTGWPRCATELTALGGDVTETADGAGHPAPAAARRRLALLRRPPDGHGRRGARPASSTASWSTTSTARRKTMPDFPGMWADAARRALGRSDAWPARARSDARRGRRPDPARPARQPAPLQAAARARRTPSTAWWSPSTAAGSRCCSTTGRAGDRDAGARARAASRHRGRRPGRRGRRPVRRRRTRWRASCAVADRARPCCAAPPTTTTRSSG